jgi:hypothetical protein
MLGAYLCATFAFPKPGGRIIVGDATHHFVQLRSLVFDHDLSFKNDYMRLYGLQEQVPETDFIFSDPTPTGLVRNYMPIGPALLWAPAYLVTTAIDIGLASLKLRPWPDGFDRSLQVMPGVTGVIAATIGVWLAWRLSRKYTNAAASAVGAIALLFGTHAIYYAMASPSYSHAASMLTSGVFFWRWLGRSGETSLRRVVELGALAGVSALMRWQDALFMITPLWLALTWPTSWGKRLMAAIASGLAFVAVFSPQMMAWKVLYGRALTIPQGPSFLQWSSPHPIAVLFSDNHGLFTWTPLIVLSVWGLATFVRRERSVAVPVVAILLASWYVNAAVADWYAGEAFGARRFLSLLPLFVLGLSVWLGAASKPRLAVVWTLVAANWLLLLQYETFMKGLRTVAPYPRAWFDMWVVRFLVPFRLLKWWRR